VVLVTTSDQGKALRRWRSLRDCTYGKLQYHHVCSNLDFIIIIIISSKFQFERLKEIFKRMQVLGEEHGNAFCQDKMQVCVCLLL
jgi:hypothetical protein